MDVGTLHRTTRRTASHRLGAFPPQRKREHDQACKDWVVFWGAVLLSAVVYYSAVGIASPSWTTPQPNSYFGHLTEGFLAGQTHLNLIPDPRLLELENPYAGPQGTSRPHDMSFYNGRFYLYYGATPALLLYTPWTLLTGSYLHEMAGTVFFLHGGFVFGACWLLQMKRRLFPEVSPFWFGLVLSACAFGPPLLVEAHNPTFYAVPISAAFFCLMLATLLFHTAANAVTWESRLAGIAATGAVLGLAAGARPIHVLTLVPFALATLWLGRRSRHHSRDWLKHVLSAAVAPAALVGLAIGWYNFARFENPFDFGIQYSLATTDLRGARLVGPEFIQKNLHLYLLGPVALTPYFPFIETFGRAFGILPVAPFVLLAALSPLAFRGQRQPRYGNSLGLFLLLGGAISTLSMLCLFFGEQARYLVDFAPPLMFAAAFSALALLQQSKKTGRGLRSLVCLAVSGLAIYSVGAGVALGLNQRAHPELRLSLQRWLNQPAHLVERLIGSQWGPVEMDVVFPAEKSGMTEPLLSTVPDPATGDVLYVKYTDDRHIQFGLFHTGSGGPLSKPIPIDYARVHRVQLHLGSLYPPAGHPLAKDIPTTELEQFHRRLEVKLNGNTVLRSTMEFYPATPASLTLGRSRLAQDVTGAIFTGQIARHERLGIAHSGLEPYGQGTGAARLRVRFPQERVEGGLPLVATGQPGAGDLVYAVLTHEGKLAFGHDSWGSGSVVTEAFETDLTAEHQIVVHMPSMEQGKETLQEEQRLRIAFNGTTLMDLPRPFHRANGAVTYGFNSVRSSAAKRAFPGLIADISREPLETRPDTRTASGPIELAVTFPPGRDGTAEPLLVTGVTGRADVIYVEYVDPLHIRFAHDHWGVGAEKSSLVRVDMAATHRITISMASLIPPAPGSSDASAPTVVQLNGQTVLTSRFVAYPSGRDDLEIGTNSIGASSCQAAFSGTIHDSKRIGR